MKVSACFAIFNERQILQKVWPENIDEEIDEWLIADNGSTDGAKEYLDIYLKADVEILFKKNVGIARSHNALFSQASGDLIILTGCNRILPKNWVRLFKDYFTAFPDLVTACIYNDGAIEGQRVLGPAQFAGNLAITPGVIMDVICFHREIFREIGYYDTNFGLWGMEDLEFSERIHKYCKANKKIAGFIPNIRNKHFGFSPTEDFDPKKSSLDYYDLKVGENNRFAEKEKYFYELKAKGFPPFKPF